MRGVRDGLVALEPPPGRHVVVQHPVVAALRDPPPVRLVLAAEQLAEGSHLRDRVGHRHGHGGHDGRAGRRRGRRRRRRRRRRGRLLLRGRVLLLGRPRFRWLAGGRTATGNGRRVSGGAGRSVGRFRGGRHRLGFDAHHVTIFPQSRACRNEGQISFFL